MDIISILFFIGMVWLYFKINSKPRKRTPYEQKKFREEALRVAKRDRYGNIQDAYTGKYHKAKSMDADHIYPYSKGGANAAWNSAMTHKSVNRSKGDKISPKYMAKGYANNSEAKKKAKKAGIGAAVVGSILGESDI